MQTVAIRALILSSSSFVAGAPRRAGIFAIESRDGSEDASVQAANRPGGAKKAEEADDDDADEHRELRVEQAALRLGLTRRPVNENPVS